MSDDRVAAVRRALAAHHAFDDRERSSVDRLLAELDRLPHPFDRDADLTHITASAIVVGPPGTVLHLHKRLHRWLQPGGHVDPGEEPWETAQREVREETGLAAVHPPNGPLLLQVDVHEAAAAHVHLDLRYLLLTESVDIEPAEGESVDVRWFSWDEARELADPGLIGSLERARRWVDAHR